MKVKYLLRGIGVGAILAAAIMYFLYGSSGKVLSDDEIRQKARELGMMTVSEFQEKELDSLKDKLPKEDDKISEEKVEKKEDLPQSEKKSEKSSKAVEKPKPVEEQKIVEKPKTIENPKPINEVKHIERPQTIENPKPAEPTKPMERPKKPEPQVVGGKVNFSITAGMSSEKVAASLKAMGLVDNTAEFNKYLVNNGFASKLKVGTFELQTGWSYNEIASQFTK
ncbi:MAG: hypothetical protein ACTTKP_06995 [Catonella sp.]|uniref:hypothetical protein n=1 Tax=Catonella sp. TaxID=2382125 RepID=UPI003FA03521